MVSSTDIFEQDQRYGRYVRLMKTVMPVLAVVTVLLLVLYPLFSNTETGFTLDFAEITEQDDTIRMVSPHYTGTDAKGRDFQIRAETAYQSASVDELVYLDQISADVTLPSGAWMALDGLGGVYQRNADLLDLTGQVNIFSDIGYEAHSRAISLDFVLGTATSSEQVHGQGPFGVFESGGMEMDMEGNYVHLTQGVRMTVYPRANQRK